MARPDYSFQKGLERRAYAELVKSGRVVLAAAPGAGKTDMAINLIARWVRERAKRVLVLTHGQTILRSQFAERIGRKPRSFDYCVLDGSADRGMAAVHVALPHYFASGRDAGGYSLIVVDEAHHFFRAEMVQRIIAANPNAKLLLLTGSPSPFINDTGFHVIALSALELLDRNVIVDPRVELVQTDLPFTYKDYNETDDLKTRARMRPWHISRALTDAMDKLCGAFSRRAKLGKTLVICNRQEQAILARKFFARRRIEALISTSDTDADARVIEQFKNGSASVLVVVNRGILGFDYPELMNAIDISCSMNPDRLFQALCRVIRRSNERPDAQKTYIKVAPTNLAELTHHVMSFVMAMSSPEIYGSYAGAWKDVKIAKAGEIQPRDPAKRKAGKPPKIRLPRFYTFREIQGVRTGVVKPTHWSTFNETRELLGSQAIARDTGIEMFRSGKSIGEIARALGIPIASVYRWLRKAKIALPDHIPSSVVGAWVKAYSAGSSAKAIAEKTGYAISSVLKYLRLSGVNVSSYRYAINDSKAMTKIARAYANGAALKKLAGEFGVSRGAIESAVKRSGLHLRKKARVGKKGGT